MEVEKKFLIKIICSLLKINFLFFIFLYNDFIWFSIFEFIEILLIISVLVYMMLVFVILLVYF